jgi:hypothetical protein
MSVAERKIPVPRYPESAAHEMKFNAGVFSFTVARADNGFIFQEYDAAIFNARHAERTTIDERVWKTPSSKA